MRQRSYDQFCALARALDVVGERWNLLVVRELLAGPKRYSDLMHGLPGISTDMLAARLKDLEKAGVVTRRSLPKPAASVVYELTAEGRELEPAVLTLARWGMRRLGSKKRSDAFRIEWLELNLKTMFRPEHAKGPPLTLEFLVGRERLQLRIGDGAIHAVTGDPVAADVSVATDVETLAELARDPSSIPALVSGGRLRARGAPEAITRANKALGIVAG